MIKYKFYLYSKIDSIYEEYITAISIDDAIEIIRTLYGQVNIRSYEVINLRELVNKNVLHQFLFNPQKTSLNNLFNYAIAELFKTPDDWKYYGRETYIKYNNSYFWNSSRSSLNELVDKLFTKNIYSNYYFNNDSHRAISLKVTIFYCVKDYLKELCSNNPLRIKYLKCNLTSS